MICYIITIYLVGHKRRRLRLAPMAAAQSQVHGHRRQPLAVRNRAARKRGRYGSNRGRTCCDPPDTPPARHQYAVGAGLLARGSAPSTVFPALGASDVRVENSPLTVAGAAPDWAIDAAPDSLLASDHSEDLDARQPIWRDCGVNPLRRHRRAGCGWR
ncbi:hypothetical protein BOS5A_211000 [Bosea sp. EC-HK365B]|nr:hypothetical protein BOSE21B_30053 [Bosea sp. 21B]VVT60209.1 hypothetical protein BOS5A_211000 [Bosea sp. EC-HK365B]VXC21605.1 hypothetical protein BOSE127_170498 [Bosea sp. 127]